MNLSDRLGDAAAERSTRARVRFQPLDEPVETVRAIDLTGDVARVRTAAAAPPATASIDLRDGGDRVEIVLPLAEAAAAPPAPTDDAVAGSSQPRTRRVLAWLRLAQSRPDRPHRRITEPSQALVAVSADATRPTSPLPALRPVAFDPVVRTPPVVHLCPACGEEGRIDIDDPNLGEVYLSCPNCFKMWQVHVDRASTG